ncbi:MAG: NUDIX hydrolase [Bacilli bacterium]|nr:NUDIX hydrolase [Bacilli bacterium]
MEYIKVLTDEDFGLNNLELTNPRIRVGARGIIFNNENKIAILNKQKKNEYKLVGGGVESGETPEEAFEREVLEETGHKIKIDKKIGVIKEIKSHDNFEQVSHVFVAHIIGKCGTPNFTEKEKDEGSKLMWVDLDEAMTLIKNCESNLVASKYENVYHTKFIVKRDYEIINFYKEQR